MTKCPKCGTDMDPKKPCPDCGHEINAPSTESKDGIKPPKVVEEDPKPNEGKDGCGTKGKKAKVDGESIATTRIDYWDDLNASATMTKPFKKNDNGSLVGKAAIFGVGVYRYMGPGGKVTSEFRPPEEVFSKETLDSYKLLPLTFDHPKEKVTPENFKKYVVGAIGEEIENDAYNAYAEIAIHDAEAIAAVEAGTRGLSMGYSCDLVTDGTVSYPKFDWDGKEIGRTVYTVPGNFNGTPYDAIQVNNRGNHGSIVKVPRGGDLLNIRLDGADVGVGIRVPGTQTTPTQTKETESMKKIKLDGQTQEHEVPEAVAIHIDGLEASVANLTKDKADAESKVAAANAAVEAMKADAAALNATIPAKVQEGISARLALVAKVDGLKVEVKHEDSEETIKVAVVKAAMPTVNIDGADATKLDAYFEAACTVLEGRKADSGVQTQLQQLHGDGTKVEDKVDGSDWAAYQQNYGK